MIRGRDRRHDLGGSGLLPYLQPPLTDEAVANAEEQIRHTLPAAYLALLKKQNGGYIRFSLPLLREQETRKRGLINGPLESLYDPNCGKLRNGVHGGESCSTGAAVSVLSCTARDDIGL